MSLFEVKDLTVEYSSAGYVVRPIHGFNLEMERGELGIILGASGCGKSTLLSAIAGLLRPSAGSILVDGTDVTKLNGNDLTRYRQRSVGIVFQAFNLIPSLTARENIELVLRTAGRGRSAAFERSTELLQQMNLNEHAHHRPGALSGGQQQRVAIGRALALDPPLVLADEPTAHLDYIQVEGVLNILRQLADSNRTVLVATHDERLLPLADRIIELTPRQAPVGGPAEIVPLSDGEILFRQGDPGSRVYEVESGVVRLLRERSDGTEEVLQEVGVGAYFGELAPMFGLPRSATAQAVGITVVKGMPLSDFRTRMRQGDRTPTPHGATP
jgi:putative ABC transport system ATP-binding protein